MKKNDIDDLITLWEWFKSNSNDLILNPTRSDLIVQLDTYVSKLGQFDWEIGPWKDETYFAISPNLSNAKLELTREFIKHAPVCIGWHFLSSKPLKSEWKGIWEIYNEKGKKILVDSNNWQYVLYQFEDGTFDIDIKTDAICGDNETVNLAIDIALTSYLGEELYMTAIGNINKVDSFEKENENKATLIRHIKKHIENS